MSSFIVNSFQIPNAVIDELMADLSGAELKCYLYVLRKTKGWNKQEDAISTSQFMAACNLSNRKVIDACNRLVELGLLEQKNGARGVKVFSVKSSTYEESSHVKKVHSTYEESSQDPMKKVHTQNNNINNTTKNNNNNPLPPKGESASADTCLGETQKTKIDYQSVIDIFNDVFADTPVSKIKVLNDERKKQVRRLAKELNSQFGVYTTKAFEDYFLDFKEQTIQKTWYWGQNDRNWVVDLDYITRPKVFAKTVENSL